jgi:hypothetical protein
MTARVYYHHPEDSQYSLAYVTQNRDDITTSGQDAIIEHYDLDEEFFVLYTNQWVTEGHSCFVSASKVYLESMYSKRL